LIAALGAAPFAVPLLAHAQTIETGSKFKQISSRERIRQRYFPNLVLTSHEGKKLKFYDDLIKDKIVIFNMFYAQCQGICSPITRNLVRLQKILGDRVGKDIFMYSFTLKPKEDNVKALAHYAEMHKVAPGWLFLTGSADDMEVIKYGNEPMERWGGCPGMQSPEWIAETLSWVDWPKNQAKLKANGGGK
jgi:protein SCO1/2